MLLPARKTHIEALGESINPRPDRALNECARSISKYGNYVSEREQSTWFIDSHPGMFADGRPESTVRTRQARRANIRLAFLCRDVRGCTGAGSDELAIFGDWFHGLGC